MKTTNFTGTNSRIQTNTNANRNTISRIHRLKNAKFSGYWYMESSIVKFSNVR